MKLLVQNDREFDADNVFLNTCCQFWMVMEIYHFQYSIKFQNQGVKLK